MSLRIAVTRALPDAQDTARAIRARGGEPLIAPLLTTIPRAFDANIDGAQALIFTSAAAVRAFANAHACRVPALTVGDASAAAARAAGFADVRSAGGDAAALAALIIATLDPQGGKLIHIRGEHVAGDIAEPVTAAGFSLDRRIAYSAAQARTLPPALAEPLDVVLLYSARAAAALRALGAPDAASRTAACLSQGVAEAAGPGWGRVIVAPRPREDALLNAIFAP